jgi:hypothetical protein
MKSDVLQSRQNMPTAAKAVAAIVLAICAFGCANVLTHRFPALSQIGVNPIFFATVGYVFGWIKIGPMAEIGYRAVWRAGIGAAIATTLSIIAIAAAHHIYQGMQYHAYKTVDQMLTGYMNKVLENFLYLADPYIWVAICSSGLLAGVFSGFAARLWR